MNPEQEQLRESIQKIQDKVNSMGFKGQNEYDLHLREELVDFLSNIQGKVVSDEDKEKAKLLSITFSMSQFIKSLYESTGFINEHYVREQAKEIHAKYTEALRDMQSTGLQDHSHPTKTETLVKLPKMVIYDLPEDAVPADGRFTAYLQDTGIVVSASTREQAINELMTSIKVQLCYEAGEKPPADNPAAEEAVKVMLSMAAKLDPVFYQNIVVKETMHGEKITVDTFKNRYSLFKKDKEDNNG